jgi:hypothetical protein
MAADSSWSSLDAIGQPAGDNRAPALAAIGDTLHLVWVCDRALQHARYTRDGWTMPTRLTAGDQPVLAATPDGGLHCLFSHWVRDNAEIFYISWNGAMWSLPVVVSRTSGVSVHPALAAGPDGSLHAAWTDTTPGRPVIYYGSKAGPVWRSIPIPNGSGSHPSIVVHPSGMVYIAWQDRIQANGQYDIFATTMLDDNWSLAANVSDRTDAHSISAKLAVNALGACHMVWQEEREGVFGIRHADQRPTEWALPADASAGEADCRQPAIAANRKGLMQVVWAEGPVLKHRVRPPDYEAAWWDAENASDECAGLSDLALAIMSEGVTHVVLSRYAEGDSRRLFHLQRRPIFKHANFLPIG